MEVKLPCGGEDVRLNIPDENILAVLLPREIPPVEDVDAAVRKAVENPIGSKRISQIAKPNSKVALLLDSWKRPTRHFLILPAVLDELKKAGVKDDNIKLIFGNGVHRHATREELEGKLGQFVDRYEVIQHNRTTKTAFIGVTSRAANPVWINSDAAAADVKIAIGNIGFNILAGYGGGAKMICPGLSSYETISLNHRLDLSPLSSSGNVEDNPVRYDLEEMGRLAGLDFIVNAVHNKDGKIVHVVAGDFVAAHREGVKVSRDYYRRPVPALADILVASANPRYTIGGAPIDDLPWAVMMTSKVVRQGGTMIFAHRSPWPERPIVHAKCPFATECEKWFLACRPEPEQVLLDICQGRIPGWISLVYVVSDIMAQKDVVVWNEHFSKETLAGSGWIHADSMEQALADALRKHGKDAKIIVAPYGGRMTFPVVES